MNNMVASGEVPDGFHADPQQQAAAAEQDAQKQAILKQILSPEAMARLGRVKLVKAAKAEALIAKMIQMAMKGEITSQVTEEQLISLLETVADSSQMKVKVQRRSVCVDEEDNDDDLF